VLHACWHAFPVALAFEMGLKGPHGSQAGCCPVVPAAVVDADVVDVDVDVEVEVEGPVVLEELPTQALLFCAVQRCPMTSLSFGILEAAKVPIMATTVKKNIREYEIFILVF